MRGGTVSNGLRHLFSRYWYSYDTSCLLAFLPVCEKATSKSFVLWHFPTINHRLLPLLLLCLSLQELQQEKVWQVWPQPHWVTAALLVILLSICQPLHTQCDTTRSLSLKNSWPTLLQKWYKALFPLSTKSKIYLMLDRHGRSKVSIVFTVRLLISIGTVAVPPLRHFLRGYCFNGHDLLAMYNPPI